MSPDTVDRLFCMLRKPEVLKIRGQSESCFDRDVRDGFFPPPVKLSPDPSRRAVGWPAHEVEALNRALIAGNDAESIRRLVSDLLAARAAKAAA